MKRLRWPPWWVILPLVWLLLTLLVHPLGRFLGYSVLPYQDGGGPTPRYDLPWLLTCFRIYYMGLLVIGLPGFAYMSFLYLYVIPPDLHESFGALGCFGGATAINCFFCFIISRLIRGVKMAIRHLRDRTTVNPKPKP